MRYVEELPLNGRLIRRIFLQLVNAYSPSALAFAANADFITAPFIPANLKDTNIICHNVRAAAYFSQFFTPVD